MKEIIEKENVKFDFDTGTVVIGKKIFFIIDGIIIGDKEFLFLDDGKDMYSLSMNDDESKYILEKNGKKFNKRITK